MKWSARQYYIAMPHEYYAAAEGYLEERQESLMITRISTHAICCAMAGYKEVGEIDTFWPIKNSIKKDTQLLTPEQSGKILEQAKKRADKLKNKIKNVEST